jgi:hypothetical protein
MDVIGNFVGTVGATKFTIVMFVIAANLSSVLMYAAYQVLKGERPWNRKE